MYRRSYKGRVILSSFGLFFCLDTQWELMQLTDKQMKRGQQL